VIRLETETVEMPAEVFAEARRYFGEELGLTESGSDARSVTFQGGGGGVSVAVSRGETRTVVELVSQEWDYQAEQFIGRLKR
jgi:hypothetical protein